MNRRLALAAAIAALVVVLVGASLFGHSADSHATTSSTTSSTTSTATSSTGSAQANATASPAKGGPNATTATSTQAGDTSADSRLPAAPTPGGVVTVSGGQLPSDVFDAYQSGGGELVETDDWQRRFDTLGMPTINGSGVRLVEAQINTQPAAGGWQRSDQMQWLFMDIRHASLNALLDDMAAAAGVDEVGWSMSSTSAVVQGANCTDRTYAPRTGGDGVGWHLHGCGYPRYRSMFAAGFTRDGVFTSISPPPVEPTTDAVSATLGGVLSDVSVVWTHPDAGSMSTLTTTLVVSWSGYLNAATEALAKGPLAGWRQSPGDTSMLFVGSPGAQLGVGHDDGDVRRDWAADPMSSPVAARSPIGSRTRWLPVVGLGAAVWLAPTVAARWWSSTGWSPGRSLRSMAAAYQHLLRPERIGGSGLDGARFAMTTIAVLAAVLAVEGMLVGRVWRRDAATRRGLASGRDLDRFSRRAIVARSTVILGARDPDPGHAGLLLGRERWSRREVWIPKEATVLVLAPPRSGKTSGTVAPAVVDHHGPVLATGVREDIMTWTHPWRSLRPGRMWLCEPMRNRSASALPAGVALVRWSPLQGCEEMVTARLRAEALFAALPKGGSNDEFWRTAGQTLLAGYLLAAARHDGTINDVLAWVDRDTDSSPVDSLRYCADLLDDAGDQLDASTLRSVAAQLEAAIGQDPRYRAGVTGQALQALEPFRLPQVQQMCKRGDRRVVPPRRVPRRVGHDLDARFGIPSTPGGRGVHCVDRGDRRGGTRTGPRAGRPIAAAAAAGVGRGGQRRPDPAPRAAVVHRRRVGDPDHRRVAVDGRSTQRVGQRDGRSAARLQQRQDRPGRPVRRIGPAGPVDPARSTRRGRRPSLTGRPTRCARPARPVVVVATGAGDASRRDP